MKTWLKVVIGVVISIFVMGVIALIFNPPEIEYQSGDNTTEQESKPTKTEYLKILDHKLEYGEFGNLMVVGIAENVAGRQLTYAEIRVKFYDKDNVLIGTSFDNINDLGAGEKWKFEVMYLSLDIYEVNRYEIAVGTTW